MSELKNVYFMGKYRKSDKEFLDDIEEGALVIAMDPTHENCWVLFDSLSQMGK